MDCPICERADGTIDVLAVGNISRETPAHTSVDVPTSFVGAGSPHSGDKRNEIRRGEGHRSPLLVGLPFPHPGLEGMAEVRRPRQYVRWKMVRGLAATGLQ